MENKKEVAFKELCKLVNLESEYPGYNGESKWAVLTDLSESELHSRFGDYLDQYKPFIHMTLEMYNPIREYSNNDRRQKRRDSKFGDCYEYSDELSPSFHKECECIYDDPTERIDVRYLLDMLNDMQRRRVIDYFWYGYTYEEIGRREGASIQAVRKCILNALAKMRATLETQV